MLRLTIQHPIGTLDNQLLFPAGTLLTRETLNSVICRPKPELYPSFLLFSYRSVKDDVLHFLSAPPYTTIFSDKKKANDILNLLGTFRLFSPVLQSLDYFKEHDIHTYAHILLVFALSAFLAEDLIPDYQEVIRVSASGPTHDIGKICVPLPILKKRAPLTKSERSFIEHHAIAGHALLSYFYQDTQHLACQVALDHHERRDASGYPRGILLKDPMVEIIAVSDIYDALLRPRPYRSSAYDNRTALEEITKMAGQDKISRDMVHLLIAHNRKSKPHYREIKISAEKRGTPPPDNVYGITAEDPGQKGRDG